MGQAARRIGLHGVSAMLCKFSMLRLAIELALRHLDGGDIRPTIVAPQIIYRESSPVPTYEEIEYLKRCKAAHSTDLV